MSLLKKSSKEKNESIELTYQSDDIEIEENDFELYEIRDIIDSKIFEYDKMSDKKFSDSDLYYLID